MSSTTPPPAHVPVAQTLPTYSWRTLSPSAKLLYIQTVHQANEAISLLRTDIVGFDLEWKPNFSKYQRENPVALIQIANNDYILLIQVSSMSEFPERVKEYLQNPDILKAGVGIQKDVEKLFRDYQVVMRSCVDLALLARSVDNAKWKGRYTNPIGLARLVATYESFEMDKGKTARSNWEKRLTPRQQEYAGNDAHAGFVLYTRLEDIKDMMANAPSTECYTFDCRSFGAPWVPHNPDYDPGPPPPPKVKKEKPSSDSPAAEADPNAPSGSTVSPESPPQIEEGANRDGEPAVKADSLVPQRSNGSTTFLISDNGDKRPPLSEGSEGPSSVPEICPNPSMIPQTTSQRKTQAPPTRGRGRFRGKRPQQRGLVIPQGPSRRSGPSLVRTSTEAGLLNLYD